MNKYVPMIIMISALAMVFIGIMFVVFNTTDVLENISIDFTYIEALLTLGAIAVAIYMPKRIADQQNKIALFEKKYELYTEYSLFVKFAEVASRGLRDDTKEKDKYAFGKIFIQNLISEKYLPKPDDSGDENLDIVISMIRQVRSYSVELEKIKYLFYLDKRDNAFLESTISILNDLPFDINDENVSSADFEKNVKSLAKLIADPTIKMKMQQQLKLDLR